LSARLCSLQRKLAAAIMVAVAEVSVAEAVAGAREVALLRPFPQCPAEASVAADRFVQCRCEVLAATERFIPANASPLSADKCRDRWNFARAP